MPRPLCPVPGCPRELPLQRAICYRHWTKLPRRLRDDIYESAPWKPGNEEHQAFHEACVKAAVAYIQLREAAKGATR